MNIAHEGDWEHITVRISKDGKRILKIFFAAHGKEGVWKEKASSPNAEGFSLNSSGHPIVYSAWRAHASYCTAGRQERSGLTGVDDWTSNEGPKWKCWENVIDVGDRENPLNKQYWIKYSGRWGELGIFGGNAPIIGDTGSSGPIGPAFKGKWYDDDEIYKVGKITFKKGNHGQDSVVGETSDDPGQVIGLISFLVGIMMPQDR